MPHKKPDTPAPKTDIQYVFGNRLIVLGKTLKWLGSIFTPLNPAQITSVLCLWLYSAWCRRSLGLVIWFGMRCRHSSAWLFTWHSEIHLTKQRCLLHHLRCKQLRDFLCVLFSLMYFVASATFTTILNALDVPRAKQKCRFGQLNTACSA